jgi:hypothetical protein
MPPLPPPLPLQQLLLPYLCVLRQHHQRIFFLTIKIINTIL